MHFSFSAVNDNNGDENEIPFSAEERKRKSPVPISQNLDMFSCEHNIFGPTQMTFFGTKTKNKTKMKIHFWPKTEKADNDQIAHFRRRKQKRVSVGF